MALTAYRRQGYIGAVKQASQGTGLPPTKFFKFLRHGLVADQAMTSYRDPNTRDYTFTLKESTNYKGAFQTFLYADEGAALTSWAFGADLKSGAVDPYTHTITLTDGLPWLSVEVGYYTDTAGAVQLVDRAVDAKIGMFTLSAEAKKPVTLDLDIIGPTFSKQASAATPSYTDAAAEGPMVYHQGAFTITGPTDAATLQAQIEKFELKLNQNLLPVYANALTAIGVVEQGREVEFRATAIFSGPTIYQLTYYGATGGTTPSPAVGTGAFTSTFTASANRTAAYTLNNLEYKVAKLEINPDINVARVEIEARARRQLGGATLPISAVFTNGIVAQYT